MTETLNDTNVVTPAETASVVTQLETETTEVLSETQLAPSDATSEVAPVESVQPEITASAETVPAASEEVLPSADQAAVSDAALEESLPVTNIAPVNQYQAEDVILRDGYAIYILKPTNLDLINQLVASDKVIGQVHVNSIDPTNDHTDEIVLVVKN